MKIFDSGANLVTAMEEAVSAMFRETAQSLPGSTLDERSTSASARQVEKICED